MGIKTFIRNIQQEVEDEIKDGLRAEGRVEGRAEGRVEGRAEGRVEGRAETLDELRAMPPHEALARLGHHNGDPEEHSDNGKSPQG